MSVDKAKDIVIFYAWQSDLPDSTNRNAIRYALREASSCSEKGFASLKLHIVLDEATRGDPGSPNIPAAILRKIDKADIFVCDITPVNGIPNPNVVYELGYAVSRLGWGRVIMLFNKAFGKFPDNVPFDFDRHRVSQYSLAEPSGKTTKKMVKEIQQPLVDMLCDALRAIIRNNPDKSFKVQYVTDVQKREKDIENLRWLMSKVDIHTLDTHIDEMPYKVNDRIFNFWEDFDSVVGSGHFYLYDEEARRLVEEVKTMWGASLSFGHQYHSHPQREVSFFSESLQNMEEERSDWNKLVGIRKRLFKSFRALLAHIREHYLEINLEELSQNAWAAYVKFKKEMETELVALAQDKKGKMKQSKNGVKRGK